MCKLYGGFLAEIETSTENTFLEGHTKLLGGIFPLQYIAITNFLRRLKDKDQEPMQLNCTYAIPATKHKV